MRCSVFLRSDALPGKPRSVSTLTPYSSVGATQDAELGREIVGEVLDDERVGAERKVSAVLLAGPDRDDEPRVGSRIAARTSSGRISLMRRGVASSGAEG